MLNTINLANTNKSDASPVSVNHHSSIEPTQKSSYQILLIICLATFGASYDFVAYSFFAPFIKLAFFAEATTEHSFVLLLQTASVVAVGFLARPFGAILFGKYGDLKGRQPAMFWSMAILCATTFVIACLPTYTYIGILAPILLVIARLCQGAAFGAQMCLGWVYVAETLSRKRLATYISAVTASTVSGALLASVLSGLLKHQLSVDQLGLYGWRAALMLGTIISLIGLYASAHLRETPLFSVYKQRNQQLIKQQTKLTKNAGIFAPFSALLITTLLCLIFSSILIIIITLLPMLIDLKFSIPPLSMHQAQIMGTIGLIIGMVFFGCYADKVGKGRALMIGSFFLGLQILILYYYLSHSVGSYIIPLYALLGFFAGVTSLCPLIFVQLFTTKHRLLTIGIIVNTMAAFTGAVLRLALLYAGNQISFIPALYVVFLCLCGFMVGWFVYQSPDLRQLETF